jgi:hypothetical protein
MRWFHPDHAERGRSVELKKTFLARERLNRELDLRDRYLYGLVEVKKENWSFGNGIAQYAV